MSGNINTIMKTQIGQKNPNVIINTPTEKKEQDTPNSFKQLRKFLNKNSGLITGIHTVITAALVILLVVILSKHNEVLRIEATGSTAKLSTQAETPENATQVPISPSVPDLATNLPLPGKFKLISRVEWLAQPFVAAPTPLKTPVQYVIIHHTATENCSSRAECILHLKIIQTFHMESKKWWDIGYNFLVGGDGEAYEGRGWTSEGAHTFGYNSNSIGIAFIGTFNNLAPPQRQIAAGKLLMERGAELGYLRKDYKVLAARQLQNTQSPGLALFEKMKTWEHWVPKP